MFFYFNEDCIHLVLILFCTLTFKIYSRILQICAPGLVPIIVELVDSLAELGETARGEGGFGSTGR